MVKVMTPEEMAARKALLQTEADIPLELDYQATETGKKEKPFADLRKLSNEQLLDRLDQVDKQATLIRWRIWWEIRSRFKSDKLFGQYINELRNDPAHANLVGSQQDINRCLHAGRFCELHRINDLTKIGVQISVIYELSRPQNDDVSRQIYKDVKNKGYSYADVKRKIEQAKALSQPPAVETIDYSEPEPEQAEHESRGRYLVEVEKGQVKAEIMPEKPAMPEIRDDFAVMQEVIEEEEQAIEQVRQQPVQLDADKFEFVKMVSHIASDDEVIADIKDYIAANLIKRQPLSKIKIYKMLIEWLGDEIKAEQGNVYPKH